MNFFWTLFAEGEVGMTMGGAWLGVQSSRRGGGGGPPWWVPLVAAGVTALLIVGYIVFLGSD